MRVLLIRFPIFIDFLIVLFSRYFELDPDIEKTPCQSSPFFSSNPASPSRCPGIKNDIFLSNRAFWDLNKPKQAQTLPNQAVDSHLIHSRFSLSIVQKPPTESPETSLQTLPLLRDVRGKHCKIPEKTSTSMF